MAAQTVDSVGANQITTASRTFYDRKLLMTLHQWLAIVQFAMLFSIPEKEGQTLSWRKPGKLSAATTALTEGSPPAGSNLTLPEVTATVGQYGDFVEFTDKIIETGPDSYLDITVDLQGRQAALTWETLTQTALVAGTNVTYPTGAAARNQVSSSMPITTSQLDKAIRNLQGRHVPYLTSMIPANGGIATVPGLPGYIAIVNPTQWSALKNISGVEKADKYAHGGLLPGEVGKYDQIRFVLTTTGLVAAGAGAASVDVQLLPIFGQNAFGVGTVKGKQIQRVLRNVGVSTNGDPLGQKGVAGWKSYFVAKRIDEDAIERVEFYAA
jgi:N4-gp56 family major capsid protein